MVVYYILYIGGDIVASKSINQKAIDLKRDRFIRVVEYRVNNILQELDRLGRCSNRRNYNFSDKDVKRIFNEIENKLKAIKTLFLETSMNKSKFKLED